MIPILDSVSWSGYTFTPAYIGASNPESFNVVTNIYSSSHLYLTLVGMLMLYPNMMPFVATALSLAVSITNGIGSRLPIYRRTFFLRG